MAAELMFNAVWANLDTPQLVALLSCLVECKEKDGETDEVRIPAELADARHVLQTFAKHIAAVTNVRLAACLLP